METSTTIPLLDPVEIRVLGSLIEKSITTPDYYPMTLNSLTAACNQKSSRKPVVQYDEETVVLALNTLKHKRLIATATGGTSRTLKYKHNFDLVYELNPADIAALCLLFLRGPLTAGEINSNSGRLYEFDSMEVVLQVLEKLSAIEHPFIKQLPRKAGQKEQRYVHLFVAITEVEEEEMTEEPARKNSSELESRVIKIEAELTELKETVSKLMKELMG
jgi:uncharacterized protein